MAATRQHMEQDTNFVCLFRLQYKTKHIVANTKARKHMLVLTALALCQYSILLPLKQINIVHNFF
jgi:hypothetical protein